MSNCHEMKRDEVYVCEGCGVELKVVKECCEDETEGQVCVCTPCEISCCDKPLKKKE